MATSQFDARLDTGELLFDTNYLTYGLVKADFMEEVRYWPRWSLSSIDLNPNDPASYSQTQALDPIYGFSVVGAVSPIVFIQGSGVEYGSSKLGDVTTYYFAKAGPGTKYFCYDRMQDFGPSAGLKTFADDEANTLTFNSIQPPLNIVAFLTPPAPARNSLGNYSHVYTGASKNFSRAPGVTKGTAYLTDSFSMPVGTAGYAASITFSRTYSIGRHDTSPPRAAAPNMAASSYLGGMEGCFGTATGVTFIAIDAPRTQMIVGSNAIPTQYGDVPSLLPNALVIKADALPFPYDVHSMIQP